MATEEKPSRNEEEYFARVNAELIKERRAALDKARSSTERQAHYMKCPKCGADLQEVEHHHVKVDRCPECKGVWLDAGEIEMIEHAGDSGARGFLGSLFGRRGA
jgi:hypothetical protein